MLVRPMRVIPRRASARPRSGLVRATPTAKTETCARSTNAASLVRAVSRVRGSASPAPKSARISCASSLPATLNRVASMSQNVSTGILARSTSATSLAARSTPCVRTSICAPMMSAWCPAKTPSAKTRRFCNASPTVLVGRQPISPTRLTQRASAPTWGKAVQIANASGTTVFRVVSLGVVIGDSNHVTRVENNTTVCDIELPTQASADRLEAPLCADLLRASSVCSP